MEVFSKSVLQKNCSISILCKGDSGTRSSTGSCEIFELFHRTIVNGWFCTTNAHRIMSKLKLVVQMGVIWDNTSQKEQKISLFYKNKCIFNKISTWLLNTIFFVPKIANFSQRTYTTSINSRLFL